MKKNQHTAGRKVLFILSLILSFQLIQSCQKEEHFGFDTQISPQASLLGESRVFFEQQISGQHLQVMPNNPRHRAGKIPLWDQAEKVQLSIGEGLKVPLRYQEPISLLIGPNQEEVPLAELSYLLVYKDQQSRYQYEVVTQVPNAEYWVHRNEAGRSFSGIVIVEDWWGRPIKTFKKVSAQHYILVGNPVLSTKPSAKKSDEPQNMVEAADNCDVIVTMNEQGMYEAELICDPPGGGGNPGEGGGSGHGWGNPGGGGWGTPGGLGGWGHGGGGGGGPQPPDYEERPRGGGGRRNENPPTPEDRSSDILNNLPEGCLKDVVDELIQKDCKNELTSMINQTFNISAELDLVIDGRSDFSNHIDGDASTQAGDDGYCKINIDLNINILSNAAKEYIAATMFHESIHAYLAANSRMSDLDHQVMAELYISKMVNGIQELYPSISSRDAEALAWGGLQETPAWTSLQSSNPMEANRILQINTNYRNGNLGNNCISR